MYTPLGLLTPLTNQQPPQPNEQMQGQFSPDIRNEHARMVPPREIDRHSAARAQTADPCRFVSKADLVHAVALILLPFVRELIGGLTPLHLIEAPNMGSSKGLLADVLLLPALGDVPAPMAEATTNEEWRKRITSTLLAAPTVICIDNLNRTLDAGALAAALTTHAWSDLILGKSEQIQMPVRCAWVATANNPTLSTEISRRCIRIRIDPRVDIPWQREGFKHPKLRSWVGHDKAPSVTRGLRCWRPSRG